MSVSRETGLSPPLNIILTNSLCFWRGSRSTLTAAPPAPELQTSTSLLLSLLHSDCSSLREYGMRSLPLDTYGLRPHIQPPQRSLSSFSPRTSLLTSSTFNNRFSSASAATFHRNASLQISNQRISVWNRNPLLCSKTKRIDVGLLVPPLRCGSSSDTNGVQSERSLMQWIELIGEALSTAFPVWVALGCLLGLLRPASYDWVQPRWTVLGLTVTMLGMGMTLTLDDLRGALAMPKELISGFLLQYSVMPISGYVVSKLLNLPSYYAAGLILVGCCPGGTASNIVTYIARGNVALSVLMTAMSTVAAVIMTPFLTAKLAGQFVAVDAAGLLRSTLQIVLLPVLAGAFLNQYFHGLVRFVSPLMPPIAVGTVAVLCGNAIAQSSSAILTSGMQVLLAASLLHMSGFFFGYVLARMLGIDTSSSRTISIEVGMQNSVLGVVLATQHFGNPLTAVPCAVSSVCHSIFGSVLAGIWRQSKD